VVAVPLLRRRRRRRSPARRRPRSSSRDGRLLHDETLTDQKDADYAALQAAYRTVTLTG
jgi:hypothetical protein